MVSPNHPASEDKAERQHEAIVETISEEEEEAGGRQQIEIPLSGEHVETVLHVSEFYAPDEAAEVKHVVENRTRCRRFRGGPGGRAGKAVPKTGGENGGEDGQDEDVTELLRPGGDSPAESGNERQHTGVEENVQLEKKGEGFSTGEACQMRVLLRRYLALLLPLL